MNSDEIARKRYDGIVATLEKIQEQLTSLLVRGLAYEQQLMQKIADNPELASKYSDDQPRGPDGRWILVGDNESTHEVSLPAKNLSISEKGLDYLKWREGGFKPKVYDDGAGNPTIGYGHLVKPGENFDDGISKEKAEELLIKDLRDAEKAVQGRVKVSLTQYQYDALTSLTFNIGETQFRTSTLLNLLNQGDYIGAADQFREFNKKNLLDADDNIVRDKFGKPIKVVSVELTERREIEREMFLNGKYPKHLKV